MAQKEKGQLSRRWFRSAGFWISIILSIVVLVLYVFWRPVFDPQEKIRLFGLKDILEVIEAKYLDVRFFLRGEKQPGDDIVIIAVDEKTEDELGRWQTSGRRWIAKTLDILHEGGAKVVGFDVTFAEPDEGAALIAVDEIKTRLSENIQKESTDYTKILSDLDEIKANHDYDRQLANAIQRNGNVILGVYHFLDPKSAAHLTPEKYDAYRQLIRQAKYGNIMTPPGQTRGFLNIQRSYGFEANLPMLSEAAKSYGHFNAIPYRDGYVRMSPLLFAYPVSFKLTEQSFIDLKQKGLPADILTKLENLKDQKDTGKAGFLASLEKIIGKAQTDRYKNLLLEYAVSEIEYYPSLDLEIVRAYLDSPTPIIYAGGTESGGIIRFIKVGNITIPTDEQGRLLINYYGPGYTFRHYPLSDVVLGKVLPETFKDKIVLFGFTGITYQDLHSTSFERDSYPGVEVHATIIENILQQDFLLRPEVTILVDALVILLLGIILGLVLHRTRPISGVLTAVISLMGVIGITCSAFLFGRIWLNMTFPFVFIVLDYLAITSYKYFTEEKKKKEVKNAFQHYVAPAIVNQMLERVDQLHLGGERKQLTALFSDIRGFTSISEKMPPEDLVHFLNEYLTAMTRIVLEHEGTVDKYMGDAIMAFYGAPLEQPDHAFRACKTAVDMINRLKELWEGWEARNLPPMNIGIGINSGEMSVGNMGSEERFDYTIMGDNVNLASRLEGINKQYGTNIVISQSTYEIVQDQPFIVRELDSVRVKGKHEPVTIYELMGYDSFDQQTESLVKIFDEGLNAYRNRQWDRAIALFHEALRINPDDEPSKVYENRCEAYKQNPPPENWDGVFEMKTK
jgi:class 3 adenylate cyclase/CHASE2 domain-containing sensor protein